ncbi:MAG: ATP-binding protein [Chitinispirillales bacterium]|jgi:predicted AAA+ superfamily ATPase|nr:ATP-binding protein [Chitinispirillales bacterium]
MGQVIRHGYLETLADLRDKNLIKVVTGARRVGKSTLLAQYRDVLAAEAPGVSALSINFDEPEYRFLAEQGWKNVYDFVVGALRADSVNYVFLDEVQNIPEFEKLLEGLFVHPRVDLYVTGSNAYLLSSELATLLTGRGFEINVLPFSFAEYLEFTGSGENTDRAFASYVRAGGFPEAVKLAGVSESYAFQYLQTVYKNIYENDIKTRYKIHSDISYQEVINFLADSVGSPVSPGNIAKVLTNAGKKIDNKSVTKYISTLTASYMFYRTDRYDIKGKQHLATQEKYYAVDTGFRNALLGKELSGDGGHLLENVVFLELLRRKNQVWIGKIGNSEVDFVARDSGGVTKYVQVSQTVKNPETLTRELAPFDKIPDHNEKILITADYENGSRNGIKQVNIVDWLSGEK